LARIYEALLKKGIIFGGGNFRARDATDGVHTGAFWICLVCEFLTGESMKYLTHFLMVITLSLTATSSHAEEVTLAVASNFAAPIKQLAQLFEFQTGHKVVLVFGSSGKIFAQIHNGAPYDVFLSADVDKPETLEKQGKTVAGSRFTYALGSLVLWSADPDLTATLPSILETDKYHTLALANPDLAPYGAAAMEVLQNLHVDISDTPRIVKGENIQQTYQFVHSGNADIGFVALSQTLAEAGGASWIVPDNLYSPIRQDAVQLQRAKDNAAATELIDFLQSAKAQAVIVSAGYRLPTEE
jgi:molybdate transport system substrate-binding protein